jgi:dethiobiotin synthetase
MNGASGARRPASGVVEVAVTGTGTGVGKTRVTDMLVRGLRLLGRRVWVHKPIACGGWDGATADDGRALAALCVGDQPAETVCPLQFPEPASPHLAAAAVGKRVELSTLRANLERCRGDHDLIVEGAGGLLSPLTSDRQGIADLVVPMGMAAIVVTRPDLGTLNATALTVAEARRRELDLVGLILSHVLPDDGSLAVRTAAEELSRLCGLPMVGVLPHGAAADADARGLASAVLAGRRTPDAGRSPLPGSARPAQ